MSLPSPIGAELDDYVVLEELPGLCGELVVPLFRGEDRATGDRVLLALLDQSPELDETELDSLYDRCLQLAQIESDALSPLLASSSRERGTVPPYLCWQLELGETLRSRLNRTHPDVHTALRATLGVARGLAAIHDTGEFCGCLNPARILIRPSGEGQLIGAGMGRSLEPTEPGRANNTGAEPDDANPLAGAAYRAPEQLPGGRGTIGPRSDVFSLGVVLFELIECQLPFRASTAGELLRRIERHAPPSLMSVPGLLPHAIEELIDGALQFEQQHRFRSAGLMAKRLEELISSHEPPPAPVPQPASVPRSYGSPSSPASETSKTSASAADERLTRIPVSFEDRHWITEDGLWRLWLLPGLLLTLLAFLAWHWLW